MADQNDLAVLFGMILAFLVDLGDQRAGGVDNGQAAPFGFDLHRFGDTVGAENGHGAIGNVVHFLDENGTLGAQRLDHALVVNDFMAHVDRGAVKVQGSFHNLNGPFDTGAKSTRARKPNINFLCFLRSHDRCSIFLLEKEAVIGATRFLVENKYFPAKGEEVFTQTSGFFIWKTRFRPLLPSGNQLLRAKKVNINDSDYRGVWVRWFGGVAQTHRARP